METTASKGSLSKDVQQHCATKDFRPECIEKPKNEQWSQKMQHSTALQLFGSCSRGVFLLLHESRHGRKERHYVTKDFTLIVICYEG